MNCTVGQARISGGNCREFGNLNHDQYLQMGDFLNFRTQKQNPLGNLQKHPKHEEIARRAAPYELYEAPPAGKGVADGGTSFPPKTVFRICPEGYDSSSGLRKVAIPGRGEVGMRPGVYPAICPGRYQVRWTLSIYLSIYLSIKFPPVLN